MTAHDAGTASTNDQVIAEFRANDGRVGGPFAGAPLLLMTTQGRRTGKPHTTPAVHLRDGARYLVFGSNAGRPSDPEWYLNLLAHPQATIELGTGSGVRPYAATATDLVGDERDVAWERQCAIDPTFREYERRSGRTIPVVALDVLDLTATPQLAPALGGALLEAHATLRTQLDDVRARLAAVAAVRDGDGDGDGDGRALAAEALDLHRSALAYCYGLQVHHIREDGGFTALEELFPQLTPAFDHLRAEHLDIEATLADLEGVLDRGPAADRAGVDAIGRALDRVVAGLEDHFAYEEDHLLPVIGSPGP